MHASRVVLLLALGAVALIYSTGGLKTVSAAAPGAAVQGQHCCSADLRPGAIVGEARYEPAAVGAGDLVTYTTTFTNTGEPFALSYFQSVPDAAEYVDVTGAFPVPGQAPGRFVGVAWFGSPPTGEGHIVILTVRTTEVSRTLRTLDSASGVYANSPPLWLHLFAVPIIGTRSLYLPLFVEH